MLRKYSSNIFSFIYLQVTSTTYVSTGDKTTVTATYISSEQVICNLPDTKTYNITISNTGSSVSVDITAVLFVNFDPVCYDCDVQNGCTLKVSL